ncbi:hypothetical protein D0Y65_003936 [Glycine soja]|uniref:Uncharacterized protein n=1 Tax=Glycine soja TaxID=3848 RepID=A0A445LNZ7_GLYSO|nr:hypothetical protein D0Y65_003936 [Glycine soja]
MQGNTIDPHSRFDASLDSIRSQLVPHTDPKDLSTEGMIFPVDISEIWDEPKLKTSCIPMPRPVSNSYKDLLKFCLSSYRKWGMLSAQTSIGEQEDVGFGVLCDIDKEINQSVACNLIEKRYGDRTCSSTGDVGRIRSRPCLYRFEQLWLEKEEDYKEIVTHSWVPGDAVMDN